MGVRGAKGLGTVTRRDSEQATQGAAILPAISPHRTGALAVSTPAEYRPRSRKAEEKTKTNMRKRRKVPSGGLEKIALLASLAVWGAAKQWPLESEFLGPHLSSITYWFLDFGQMT